MSQIEALKKRFLTIPADFTYNELKRLLEYYGWVGKQGDGSRVKFIKGNDVIILHKPHPGNIVKKYILKVRKR